MKTLPLAKAFMLLEPGPVILVTTADRGQSNVMTISWHMVMDFTPRFALLTGPWNYSYQALVQTRECVLAVPTVHLARTVVEIGACSGADTDKFEKFGLTAPGGAVGPAPLIGQCLANVECRVAEHLKEAQYLRSGRGPRLGERPPGRMPDDPCQGGRHVHRSRPDPQLSPADAGAASSGRLRDLIGFSCATACSLPPAMCFWTGPRQKGRSSAWKCSSRAPPAPACTSGARPPQTGRRARSAEAQLLRSSPQKPPWCLNC